MLLRGCGYIAIARRLAVGEGGSGELGHVERDGLGEGRDRHDGQAGSDETFHGATPPAVETGVVWFTKHAGIIARIPESRNKELRGDVRDVRGQKP
jgi:hypothetical protein